MLLEWCRVRPTPAFVGGHVRRPLSRTSIRYTPMFESLEDRALLSTLLVSDYDAPNPQILRYDGETGQFRGVYINAASGGQHGAYTGVQLGLDNKLYVCKSLSGFGQQGKVQRHVVRSGTYIDTFVAAGSGGLSRPADLQFGPDGDLYVLRWSGAGTADDQILRFDGRTGEFRGVFVSLNFGIRYTDMTFGPDGDLYISEATGNVQQFDGRTGTYRGLFAGGIGGEFMGLVFGPDGHLYVSNDRFLQSSVKRYHGKTGALLGDFVTPPHNGRLNGPSDLVFGPDGSLYVSSSRTDSVLRYDGQNGIFIDEFIPSGSGGLIGTAKLLFVAPESSRPMAAFPIAVMRVGEHPMSSHTTPTYEPESPPFEPELHDMNSTGGRANQRIGTRDVKFEFTDTMSVSDTVSDPVGCRDHTTGWSWIVTR